jgi:hypothetical protein
VVILLTYLYAYVGILVRYSDVTLVLVGAVLGILIIGAAAARHFIARRGQTATLKAA